MGGCARRVASRLTGEPGGLWRFRGLPPQRYFGVGFTAQGFDKDSPYKRMPGSFDPRAAFIFEGIGADEVIGDFPSLALDEGAAGQELDRVDYALGSPAHTLILAQSFGHSDAYQQVVEEVNTSDSKQGGSVNPLVHADLAFLEYPNGGAVFSTGSIAPVRPPLVQQLHEQRVADHRKRAAAFRLGTPLPAPAAQTRRRRGGSGSCRAEGRGLRALSGGLSALGGGLRALGGGLSAEGRGLWRTL